MISFLLGGLSAFLLGTLIGCIWRIKKPLLREAILIFASIIFSWVVYNVVHSVVMKIFIFIVAFIISIVLGIFITKKQLKKYDHTAQIDIIASILTGNIKTFTVYYIASILYFAW